MSKRSRSTSLGRHSDSADFQPDYSYIRADLRRIAWIAGVFVALLLITSLFVR